LQIKKNSRPWFAGHEANDAKYQDGKIYDGWKAYGQAKTALMLFNGCLARQMASEGTFVVIAHPGGKHTV
jgi:NAD(P)-dependent dehydrogenase (short-subunit alcohol dehydrogenase family)